MPDTIQPDVPAAEAAAPVVTDQPQEAPKTPREIAMEALETRHQQGMAEENGWELSSEADPIVKDEPAVDQLAAQLADPVVTPVAPVVADTPVDTPAKVKIKIDGVESEVPMDEVIRQYQKNSSADKRLAEATRLLREAQEAEAARLLRVEQEAQVRAQQAAPVIPPPEPDASGKEFLKALFEGDEENALSALEKVFAGRQQPVQQAAPTLDIAQITQAVTQQVQQKLVVESALARNRADYPQLYADPDIEGLALAKIQRMRESEGTDFFVALEAVSKEFATKFGWNTPPAAPEGRPVETAPTTSPRAAKLEQKQSIDNVTSINTKTVSTEQQPENPSDVIAAMKAARGG